MKNESNDYKIVYVTTSSIDSASHISKILVNENLAACCTVLPNAISYFQWDNSINERHECLIMIKTTNARLQFLMNRVKELHHDEVPEIIAVEIQDGFKPYLDWISDTLPSSFNN
ncbi:MAG: divalent-cation tolerance protein CutA [Candidatus Kapabacteria bacterium]|nr:divalent-cation tolerance protein CutA [Ignavibacteriota bacterium]MCW5883450.1 divalent-cation tolerance protein CutA [Candidatus Kapabacteria bacterium]